VLVARRSDIIIRSPWPLWSSTISSASARVAGDAGGEALLRAVARLIEQVDPKVRFSGPVPRRCVCRGHDADRTGGGKDVLVAAWHEAAQQKRTSISTLRSGRARVLRGGAGRSHTLPAQRQP